MITLTDEQAKRFWSKVDKVGAGGCWNWTAAVQGGGYGGVTINGRMLGAHQVALIIAGHPRPEAPRDAALHSCDNRLCVNPDHLRWGTRQENMDDMRNRGRSLRGELGRKAVLTEGDVRAVRASPNSYTELAAVYGVKKSAIAKIKTGRTWRHIL